MQLALIPLSFERPEWLWWLLLVPIVVALPLWFRSLAALEGGRKVFVLLTRTALLVALILAMAGAEHVRENRDLAVIYLLDRSRSVPDDLQLRQETFIQETSRKGPRPQDDKTAVVSFDGKTNIEQLPMRGVFIDRITPPIEPDRTDPAGAIRLALATFPEGMAKRIVLLSDGNENDGQALAEAAEAAAGDVGIDVVPLEYEHAAEVLFDRIDVPTQSNQQERVPIRMVLRTKQAARGNLVLYHNGRRISSERVTLEPGIRPFVQELPLDSTGVHKFEARFEPDDPNMDAVAENNVARAFTFVQGEGAVLLLTKESETDQAMVDALKREYVDVTMRPLDQAPEDVLDMLDYDAIILSNLGADLFTEDQRKQLGAYVSDLGGGLVMTGGDDGFGAGGWLDTAVEEVMPVKFDVKQERIHMRGALALIMHTCEMPRGNYWAEEISIAAVKALSSLDMMGLIAWSSGGTNWEIKFATVGSKQNKINQIRKISGRIGDMPDFAGGLEMAYQQLRAAPQVSQKHIIITSDGDAAGPPITLLRKLRRAKITVTTVTIGFGAHVVEPEMKRIAKETGGRYYKANNPRVLPRIFIKEAKVVRRPLIREVEDGFRPHLRITMPEITAGLRNTDIPPLFGHVLTTPRLAADEFSRVLIASDKEDPILAVRQCGLGKSIAFTSGWWTRWGRAWPGWEKFSKLWAQSLRWAMRQGRAADFEVSTQLRGRQGKIVVEALGKDSSFLNGLSIGGRVLAPDATGQTVRLQQTGPGRYEGTFPVSKNGHYVAMLSYRRPRGGTGLIKTGLSVSYSPEYRELTTNHALLQQIAERTGGEVLSLDPTQADVFRRPVQPSISRRAIWPWILAWFVIPLLLLDVAGRRLASIVAISICVEVVVLIWLLFPGELYRFWWGWPLAIVLADLVGWAVRWRTIPQVIQWLDAELRGLRASEAAAESVSHLKSVRERIREEMAERAKADAERRAAAGEEAAREQGEEVDTARRFDLGEVGDREVGDLDQAIGGARTAKPPPERRGDKPGEKEDEDADTTSRLLRAKRRAREQSEDEE